MNRGESFEIMRQKTDEWGIQRPNLYTIDYTNGEPVRITAYYDNGRGYNGVQTRRIWKSGQSIKPLIKTLLDEAAEMRANGINKRGSLPALRL
jgi:hypothetical protein